MSKKPPLSDDEVYDRVHAAWLALGKERGKTIVGDTTIRAAREALIGLQIGLLGAMDNGSDRNKTIIDPSKLREP